MKTMKTMKITLFIVLHSANSDPELSWYDPTQYGGVLLGTHDVEVDMPLAGATQAMWDDAQTSRANTIMAVAAAQAKEIMDKL